MSMSRRQAATIIGLLFSIFVIVGIASYRESGQAQDSAPNPVYAPLVSGVDEVASSSAEESPLEEGDEDGTISPEALAQMREDAMKIASEMQIIPASGPETMGFTITVAGKDIKLPDNVYIEATVIGITCEVSQYPPADGEESASGCPEMPAYALRYADSDRRISVGVNTGQITNYAPTTEEIDANRDAFQWLIDAVEAIEEGEGNP